MNNKQLLIGLGTAAAGITVFGVAVGLSAKIEYTKGDPQKAVKDLASKVDNVAFGTSVFPIDANYTTIKKDLFDDQNKLRSDVDLTRIINFYENKDNKLQQIIDGSSKARLQPHFEFLDFSFDDATQSFTVKYRVQQDLASGKTAYSDIYSKTIFVADRAKFFLNDFQSSFLKTFTRTLQANGLVELQESEEQNKNNIKIPALLRSQDFQREVNSARNASQAQSIINSYFKNFSDLIKQVETSNSNKLPKIGGKIFDVSLVYDSYTNSYIRLDENANPTLAIRIKFSESAKEILSNFKDINVQVIEHISLVDQAGKSFFTTTENIINNLGIQQITPADLFKEVRTPAAPVTPTTPAATQPAASQSSGAVTQQQTGQQTSAGTTTNTNTTTQNTKIDISTLSAFDFVDSFQQTTFASQSKKAEFLKQFVNDFLRSPLTTTLGELSDYQKAGKEFSGIEYDFDANNIRVVANAENTAFDVQIPTKIKLKSSFFGGSSNEIIAQKETTFTLVGFKTNSEILKAQQSEKLTDSTLVLPSFEKLFYYKLNPLPLSEESLKVLEVLNNKDGGIVKDGLRPLSKDEVTSLIASKKFDELAKTIGDPANYDYDFEDQKTKVAAWAGKLNLPTLEDIYKFSTDRTTFAEDHSIYSLNSGKFFQNPNEVASFYASLIAQGPEKAAQSLFSLAKSFGLIDKNVTFNPNSGSIFQQASKIELKGFKTAVESEKKHLEYRQALSYLGRLFDKDSNPIPDKDLEQEVSDFFAKFKVTKKDEFEKIQNDKTLPSYLSFNNQYRELDNQGFFSTLQLPLWVAINVSTLQSDDQVFEKLPKIVKNLDENFVDLTGKATNHLAGLIPFIETSKMVSFADILLAFYTKAAQLSNFSPWSKIADNLDYQIQFEEDNNFTQDKKAALDPILKQAGTQDSQEYIKLNYYYNVVSKTDQESSKVLFSTPKNSIIILVNKQTPENQELIRELDKALVSIPTQYRTARVKDNIFDSLEHLVLSNNYSQNDKIVSSYNVENTDIIKQLKDFGLEETEIQKYQSATTDSEKREIIIKAINDKILKDLTTNSQTPTQTQTNTGGLFSGQVSRNLIFTMLFGSQPKDTKHDIIFSKDSSKSLTEGHTDAKNLLSILLGDKGQDIEELIKKNYSDYQLVVSRIVKADEYNSNKKIVSFSLIKKDKKEQTITDLTKISKAFAKQDSSQTETKAEKLVVTVDENIMIQSGSSQTTNMSNGNIESSYVESNDSKKVSSSLTFDVLVTKDGTAKIDSINNKGKKLHEFFNEEITKYSKEDTPTPAPAPVPQQQPPQQPPVASAPTTPPSTSTTPTTPPQQQPPAQGAPAPSAPSPSPTPPAAPPSTPPTSPTPSPAAPTPSNQIIIQSK
ncbi:P97 family adhesin [Mesomycoplasma conjunctivae]|uniref:P97 family adhesin n=1 Tax=Mesomycoplasma conjunctivae TaxID=45361 RepID=UPI003DA26B39